MQRSSSEVVLANVTHAARKNYPFYDKLLKVFLNCILRIRNWAVEEVTLKCGLKNTNFKGHIRDLSRVNVGAQG